ncbi:MAG TPA: type II toxin-antitoxin system VapC family toxin [Solirubrobacterales bacterium]|nr:type II toxin-antitoxin system VapC family toxin [Solirubrobacterales bacterium]
MLVIDANVATAACGGEGGGFETLGDELASAPLMWSEARAALHLKLHKGEIGREDAEIIHARLEGCPVARIDPPELGAEAWRIAEEFGWGRTYDAEYVALAQLLECRLVTLDARLRRGAERLGLVVTPAEL